jgi:hypothetical protein
MTFQTRRLLCRLGILATWAIALVMTVPTLMDAYGAGTPYYSRTTNMDKWSSPLPYVAMVLVAAVVVTLALWWLSRWNDKS